MKKADLEAIEGAIVAGVVKGLETALHAIDSGKSADSAAAAARYQVALAVRSELGKITTDG